MESSGKDPPSPAVQSDRVKDDPVEGACGLQSLDSLPSPSNDHDDLLVCGICEELYDDDTHQPKFLACHHTFCADCLNKLSNKEQPNPASIQCPNCRSNTQLPLNRVAGLQTNFYISRIKNVPKTPEQTQALRNKDNCHMHRNRTKSYFCVTCGVSICCDCIVMDHSTKFGHSVVSISDKEAIYLQELNASNETKTLNKRNLQLIESEMAMLTAAKENALKDLETCIELANKQLEQHKNHLRSQILDRYSTQRNNLLGIQKQVQEATKTLTKNMAQFKNVTKTGDLNDLKPISEILEKVNKEILTRFSRIDLGDNYLAFESNTGVYEFNRSLCTLGKIYSKGLLPTKVAFKYGELKSCYNATITAEVYDHHGEQVTVSSDTLSVEVTDPRNTKLHTHICMAGSVYTITFEPQVGGLHKICGMFLGERLTTEQTHISVKSSRPVLKFGKNGHGKGTFNFPRAVAIDNDNCVYVADTENKLIQKFTADGKFLSEFSVAVHDKDHTTCDIALDLNKRWIVCPEIKDKNKTLKGVNRILVFNLEGELLKTYDLTDTSNPSRIAINRHGEKITSDLYQKSLYKVDGGSTFLCRMEEIDLPGYISIDDDDSIIVPDKAKGCIYIFNPDGSIRNVFGSSGTGKGQLKEPYGIATDGEYILVSEQGNSRLQVFKYDGTFVSMIGDGEDPLLRPQGMAVTKDGHVYVVDRGNHCVKKYKYKDMVW